MRQLYSNKKALKFNGKSMYLKLYLDKKQKNEANEQVFNQSLYQGEQHQAKGKNVFWEQLPSNVVSLDKIKKRRTRSQMSKKRFRMNQLSYDSMLQPSVEINRNSNMSQIQEEQRDEHIITPTPDLQENPDGQIQQDEIQGNLDNYDLDNIIQN